MKKLILSMLLIAATCSVLLAGYTFLDWPSNGNYQSGIGPAKIVAVDVVGSEVAAGTVILKRIPAGSTTATALPFGTLTCASNVLATNITTDVWLFRDDVIQRTGTATNARVRVILYQ